MLTIANRVRELQEESNKRLSPKVDYSRKRVAERLDKASRIAEAQQNAQGMAVCENSLARLFGLDGKPEDNPQQLEATDSTRDIGRKLLQSVGLREPDADSVRQAVEANDIFVSTIEAIARRAQHTIDA
jgi:hypothetical protein